MKIVWDRDEKRQFVSADITVKFVKKIIIKIQNEWIF